MSQIDEPVEHDAADEVRRVVEENLAVYRASKDRLREDVSQENQVAADYRGRLVFELLQNADDALLGRATHDDRVLFRLMDDALWVANTGRPLTAADVRGLCGLGASSKTGAQDRRRAAIGQKGLGFKSVLEITAAPEVFSSTVCLRLGRDHARALVQPLWQKLGRGDVAEVPAMRFPALLPAADEWRQLQEQGYNTAFRFVLREEVTDEDRRELAQQMLALPSTSVLFLKHLEEVRIQVETSGRREERLWLLERSLLADPGTAGGTPQRVRGLDASGLYRVDLLERDRSWRYLVAHDRDVVIGAHRGGLTGSAWEGVHFTEVSAALPEPGMAQGAAAGQRFHVFLPTEEPTGMPLLVNGAFTTDLSRQHVRVTEDPADYNRYLLARAAAVFADVLVPHLRDVHGAESVLSGLARDVGPVSRTGELLRSLVAEALADVPLLPAADGTLLALARSVFPSPALRERGADLVELLRPGVSWADRRFPAPALCHGRLGTVAAELGAHALDAAGTLTALSVHVDPVRAQLSPEPGGRFWIDPVLELCVVLWEGSGPAERADLKAAAAELSVFPTGREADGTVRREALGTRRPFLPPQASTGGLPLRRLCFLAHEVCWGTLGKTDQQALLGPRLGAWTALFDIKEFAFQAVMAAAVLPALTRARPPDEELLAQNRDMEVVAAVGRLAAASTKPDQPLRLARLTELGLFPLSRLELPCRPLPGAQDGAERWLPAYRVYLGRDWIGEQSVETLVEAAAAGGEKLDVAFLAPPARFHVADHILIGGARTPVALATSGGAEVDEADPEADVESAVEGAARESWIDFLAWLGVNHCLRLVPFQDVEDRNAAWTGTKDLTRPNSPLFRRLADAWEPYADALRAAVAGPAAQGKDIYAYVLHDLEHLNALSRAANDPQSPVARVLLEHLGRHWPRYLPHVQAQLALVPQTRVPTQRNQPVRAQSDELVTAGTDLWLYRLRRLPICPTSQGPREPAQAWRPSEELERRLGRGRRSPGDYLPVLDLGGILPEGMAGLLDALHVRPNLVPSAFTVEDAAMLCRQVQRLHQDRSIDEAVLRNDVRPTYDAMFELLSGKRVEGAPPLRHEPILAMGSGGPEFLPAEDVLYASLSGSRERSGLTGRVPLFVIDAEPGALAPLRNLFGCSVLEEVLEWQPAPGDPALEEDELRDFRAGLAELEPWLAARVAAERPAREREDRRRVRAVVARAEPVDDLEMSCTYRGERLVAPRDRRHHVRVGPGPDVQCFLRWKGPAWPPVAEDAATLAIAVADALQVNMVEAFLGLIQAPDDAVRRQLLALAGASGRLVGPGTEDADGEQDDVPMTTPAAGHPVPGVPDGNAPVGDDGDGGEGAAGPDTPAPTAAPRVPLWRFEDLLLDGQPVTVTGCRTADGSGGDGPSLDDGDPRDGSGHGDGGVTSAGPRAAPGTDLDELDRLGMRVTMAWEGRRLRGRLDVEVVDVHSPAAIRSAEERSPAVVAAFDRLAADGLSRQWPGFDVLVLVDGEIDRLIELKSSTTDTRVAAMSWNEWKSAASPWRGRFWLYVVGNLRSDVEAAYPYVRCIRDPFGSVAASPADVTHRRRSVQLRVREFIEADHVDLGVAGRERPARTDD